MPPLREEGSVTGSDHRHRRVLIVARATGNLQTILRIDRNRPGNRRPARRHLAGAAHGIRFLPIGSGYNQLTAPITLIRRQRRSAVAMIPISLTLRPASRYSRRMPVRRAPLSSRDVWSRSSLPGNLGGRSVPRGGMALNESKATPKILIADDNIQNVELLEAYLERLRLRDPHGARRRGDAPRGRRVPARPAAPGHHDAPALGLRGLPQDPRQSRPPRTSSS